MDKYQKRGFANRWEYMRHLSNVYGVSLSNVLQLAKAWGPLQEFYMLPKALATCNANRLWESYPKPENK